MSLSPDRKPVRPKPVRQKRQPPKRPWVMPVIVGAAIAVLAFALIVVVVSGQSLF